MKTFSSTLLEAALILLILALATYLRLWNLEDNPAWYSDESTHLDIAKHLLAGENRYLAIDESYLIFARLPLFEYCLAGLFSIFGVGMLVLRSFTASLGLVTVVLLYALVRELSKEKWLSLAVAFAYAIMPQAILYNRFGFSYNLLLPLILLSLWAFVHYQTTKSRRWLLLASLCLGLGCISEILMWSFLPVLAFMTWRLRWRDLFWSMGIAILPLLVYFFWQAATVPEAFFFDLAYSLGRTGGGNFIEQIKRLIENYTILLSDAWWLLGLIGVFLLRDKVLRGTCLLFFLPLLFVGRAVPLYSLSAYYTLPFLPLVAIGVGAFIYYGLTFAVERMKAHLGVGLAFVIVTLLFFAPFIYIANKMTVEAQTVFPTSIGAFLLSPADLRTVVDYIHSHSSADELVIASAPLAVLLDRPSADFQMAVIAMGFDAIHLPHDLAPERFAFNPDYREAHYVVIDNLWRNWGAVHIPAVANMLVEMDRWELVFEVGAFQVYENPEQ